MARPRKKVDEILLQKLAKLHLSDAVIADCLNISVDTLERRFADKVRTARSIAKGKIAEVLFDEAINKRNMKAIEIICKRHLGYSERIKIDSTSSDGSMKPMVQFYLPQKDE